jgi:sugar lactone lactonase YvrE
MTNNERIPEKYFRSLEITDASGHDVIYAVRAAPGGDIYLGVCCEGYSGVTARLYRYDPSEGTFKVAADYEEITGDRADSGRLPHSKIHLAICIADDGTVYAGTHLTAPPKGVPFTPFYETFGDPELGYPGGKIIAYSPDSEKAELLATPSPYEGIRVMSMDRERNILYCITFPRSHLVRVDLDSRQVKDLGRTSAENSMAMFLDRRGRVYLTDDQGFFLRYDPDRDEIERLSVRVSDASWRNGRGNHLRRIVSDPDGHTFWGVPFKSGRIFSYDTEDGPHGRVVDYGHFLYEDRFNRWPNLLGIKAMAMGKDGLIYLSASVEEPVLDPGTCYIYSFDPKTGEKRDFGVMEQPGLPGIIYAVDADTGDDGAIYFGTRQKDPPPQMAIFKPPTSRDEIEQVSHLIEVDDSPGPRDDSSLWILPKDVPEAKGPARSKFDRTPFTVVEGNFSIRELGFGDEGLLIPDGESAMNALVTTSEGIIIGATSGQRAHLFSFDPKGLTVFTDSPNAHVLQLGLIHDGPAVCRALVASPDGMVYGGTIEGSEEEPQGGRLFVYDLRQCGRVPEALGLPRRPYALGPRPMITDLGPLSGDRGIQALALSPSGDHLYGITTPEAGLFVYDIKQRKVIVKHEIPARHPCKAIVCDEQGMVYGSADMGWLFRYDPGADTLDILDVRLPAEQGREYLALVQAFTKAPDGTIYGGTQGDGMLFRLDTVRPSIETIGQPTRRNGIQALAVTHDGRLYGISNQPGDIGRLFVYDPGSHSLRDLGMVECGGVPKFWLGHQFGAMTVGPDGEIYIGESDRISHLFIYYPPIKPHRVEE